MMSTWEGILQSYRSQHFQVITRDELLYTRYESLTFDALPSSSVSKFLLYLTRPQISIKEAFVESIEKKPGTPTLFAPFISFLEKATQVAVLYGEHVAWKSPEKWSYLFEIVDANNHSINNYLVAHPPVTDQNIEQAEMALGIKLPPTYVQFLYTTNGLGLYPNELYFICGAGASRADWERTDVFQPGNFRRENYHEIASYWFQWQDVLTYERQRDSEMGTNTFLSNERHYIPFAHTIDEWCFDRISLNKQGEYSVVFWDHEERGIVYKYPDFSTWFVDVVIHGN